MNPEVQVYRSAEVTPTAAQTFAEREARLRLFIAQSLKAQRIAREQSE